MKLLVFFLLAFLDRIAIGQTVLWQDSLSNTKIYLQVDENDYDEHPHRTSGKFDVIESAPQFHPEILSIVNKALRKYTTPILNEHIQQLYVYDQFDKGDNMEGTYLGRHGFFFAVRYLPDGTIDTLEFERLIHHEFSHRLLMFEPKPFDFKSWKAQNSINYGSIKSFNRVFNPELYSKGFINKYAVSNKHEDFASFAENIFINKKVFWKAIADYAPLRKKFEIICAYYEALDPSMNRDYFLKLNSIVLE